MTDPTKPEKDKEKFAPRNVANAEKGKQQGREHDRADMARGSEPSSRSHARGRG